MWRTTTKCIPIVSCKKQKLSNRAIEEVENVEVEGIVEENDDEEELTPIPGSPPDLLNPPVGCPFVDRCTKAMKVCKLYPPEVTTYSDTHQCACWLCQKEALNK